MSESAGPNLGAEAFNREQAQKVHASTAHGPTSGDVSLGEHPIHAPESLSLGGSALQIPVIEEGQGALADTMLSLGNQEPCGLSKEAIAGLHTTTLNGDTNLRNATSPQVGLNADKDHGLDTKGSFSTQGL